MSARQFESPDSPQPVKPARPAYRVPLGIPQGDENRRAGAIVSLLLHLLIILLIAVPFVAGGPVLEILQGAGGSGPAGGGGGGNRGTGGGTPRYNPERIHYIQVAPAPVPVPLPVPAPVVPQQVIPPPPTPPPQAAPQQAPTPQPPAPVKAPEVSVVPGSGGGSGADGTAGNGPGSGGGVGSGIGTGRGSGTGPGTGGGTQANYPPTLTEMFIPPLPVPSSVKGFHLVAEFDVDETGRVRDMKFSETRDGGYNRKLREVLRSYRFRPGTTPAGTPVRMKTTISYDF